MIDKEDLKNPHAKTASKELIRDLIRQLHKGKNLKEVKMKFKNILRNASPMEIAQVEQELVNEGMPQEEIRKLCDVHLTIFRESLNKQEVEVASDHPIHIFMEEHKIILQNIKELKSIIQKVGAAEKFEEISEEIHRLKHIAKHLMEVEKHNVREENVLFPYLQKHGITEPPTIMWDEHNELKEKKKQLLELSKNHSNIAFQKFVNRLVEIGNYITEELSNHIYNENHILYPAASRVIKERDGKK